jgi:hypothetical protein
MYLTAKIVQRNLERGDSVADIAAKYGVTRQAVYHHINKTKAKNAETKTSRPRINYNPVIDWKEYNEGLVKRGEFLLNFDILYDWEKELGGLNSNKRGRPFEYPDSLMLFFLRLKCSFKLDYRTLEGIARKLTEFIPQATKAPDYTTFCVRLKSLGLELEACERSDTFDLAGDSSGLKTSNRGEYRMSKYRGKKRKFFKLHLAVDIKTKQALWCEVTREEVRDGRKLPEMVSEIEKNGKIENGYFDAAYDSKKNYKLLKDKGITPAIRPKRTATLERTREMIEALEPGADNTRLKVLEEFLEDEKSWKEKYGYGKRWGVEGRYSVFKGLFSENVWSKKDDRVKSEVMLKVNLMNVFTSFVVGAWDKEKLAELREKGGAET